MIPIFKLQLNNQILPRTAVVGYYDGKHPSLTCATSAGKIFMHHPHVRNEDSTHSVSYLNINKKINALSSGKFSETDTGETLMIGTPSNLMAYDVEKNSDVFYKDIPDGVNAMSFGKLSSYPHAMALVGGNCSIQGFDRDGNELFWTVTGDNVTALTLCDVTGEGQAQLLAGSDDYEIRAFQNEDVVSEVTETGNVIDLTSIQQKTFGYALANGSAGVYRGKTRAWVVKSKNQPVTISSFDINLDGQKELIIGWNNGKFEARRHENGELVHKDMFSAPISAVLSTDYRMDGTEQLICCASDGEIRGYVGSPSDVIGKQKADKANEEEELVNKLLKEKVAVELELKQLEKAIKLHSQGINIKEMNMTQGARIKVQITPSLQRKCCLLTVESSEDAVIKTVILFDHETGLFDGESHVVSPAKPSHKVNISITPSKNAPTELLVQALVAPREKSASFFVFEEKIYLPTFAMFAPLPEKQMYHEKNGNVRFPTPDGYQKIAGWVESVFLIEATATPMASVYNFESLRDASMLTIKSTSNEVKIITEDMSLAADLVQDMCRYLKITDLASEADFPKQMNAFKAVLTQVDEHNATRISLTTEMADNTNHVKNLVIKAEDARLLMSMPLMKQNYAELFTLNNQLIGEYMKRSSNHQALLDSLKEVNNMIQVAARLRSGSDKARVITSCRNAIKKNNIHALFYIIKTGHEEHSP